MEIKRKMALPLNWTLCFFLLPDEGGCLFPQADFAPCFSSVCV